MWWNKNSEFYSNKCFIPHNKKPPDKIKNNSWFTQTEKKFKPLVNLQVKKTEKYEECKTVGEKRKRKNKKIKKKRKLNPLLRSLKVRIFPNKEQKVLLKKWIGTTRFLYNKSIEQINKNYQDIKNGITKTYIKDFETINKLMGKDCTLTNQNVWLLETPSHPKSNSIRESFKARKTCFSLLKKGIINGFKLKFRSKKHGGGITIPKTSVSKKKIGLIYPRRKLGHLKLKSKKAKILISKGLKYDCKILLDRNRKYWLTIPYDIKIDNQYFNNRKEIVALDPGVRTFQAFYSPNGLYGEIGKNDFGKIYRLLNHLDDLQSRMSKEKSKKRYRMKKAFYRLISKIRNLISETHKKTARYLTLRFKNILLPKFETSKMVRKNNRKIKSRTARGMLTWSHYGFKMKLKSVCERTKTNLIEVTEEYTSKTCGRCGEQHSNLGSNKIFKCPSCNLEIDRDINGARNIYLKYCTSDIRGVVLDHHDYLSCIGVNRKINSKKLRDFVSEFGN